MNKWKLGAGLPVFYCLLFVAFAICFCGCKSKKSLRVMAADSLTHSFLRICDKFEKLNPDCDIILETQGSILLSRMALIRPCDVLAVADYRLVKQILHKESDWVIRFATTEMVLVWTTQSKDSDRMKVETWPEILLKENITLGLANPEQDPCGYFTILCWKLAERYYRASNKFDRLAQRLEKKVPAKKLAFDSGKLLARLQAFNSDYAFAYKCQAEDMHLPYLSLPPEFNLGKRNMNEVYRRVSIKGPDYRGSVTEIEGAAIELGITIPASCRDRELAEKFIKFVLSESGGAELENSSLGLISPPITDSWGKSPEFLSLGGK